MITIGVSHNFETAHRLPQLGGKCTNLHGHSWKVQWTFTGELDDNGIIADYGDLKKVLRGWVDEHLDHGAMLGADDPLTAVLKESGCKVYVFGRDQGTVDLAWPTVENVAIVLARLATRLREGVELVAVTVRETATNTCTVSGP